MSDLSYFYESDLDKGTLISFYNSLPSHLRSKFKDSMGGLSILDRDSTNFLQGYRGPHTNGGSGDSEYLGPCNGLQEVRHWWGVSKQLLWIPIGGIVGFTAGRVLQDTDWHSLYFDSKTGECLSHNRNRAAQKLNNKGRELFRNGKYAEAHEYHNNAYQACSSGYEHEQTFQNDRDEARAEEEAVNLNKEGERLFNKGRYAEALKKYKRAYDKSQIRKEYDKYKSNKAAAQAEIDAIHLNSEGDSLFHQSQYNEALNKYENAYDLSNVKKEFDKYLSSKMRAQAEVDAIHLNSVGDSLFNESKYSQALTKYQEACNKSQIKREHDKYCSNKMRAQVEIEALNLNSEGDKLFSQSKYFEALGKYQEAYCKSKIKKEQDKYWSNKMKSQTEIEALNLNSDGDKLFSQSKYFEALGKYQEAYCKSKIKKEHDKYWSNKMRAQVEIESLNLNSKGDEFFSQSKYAEALIKYQAAYDKSDVEKEKIKYARSKNNVQALINKLLILDTIWKKAWEAENDVAIDRSGEAKDLFQRVLNESKDSLKTFPDILRLKQYEILASLKIDGNELFNEGLEAQQDGVKLEKEAQELQQQENFNLALIKYREAQNKFSKAQDNFETGSQNDQRFVPCIEFVQDQLENVLRSIENIEQHMLRSRLSKLDVNTCKTNCLEADFSLRDITEDYNYSKQI